MRRLSYLALSTALMAAPALAVPTSPSDHGAFDGGAFPPQASGIVTYVDLGNTLASYVTQVSLTSTLSAYLTTATASSTYVVGSAQGGNAAVSAIGINESANVPWFLSGGVYVNLVEARSGGLSGTGNAYACLNDTGLLYRSSTACQ